MTRSRGRRFVQRCGLTGCLVLLGWLSPGPGTAGVAKVDVCHWNGTGAFHLITVGAPAIQAHKAHGDALPGEAVSGHPGLQFDDACNEVTASTCPCHLTPAGLAGLGIDLDPARTYCASYPFIQTGFFELYGYTVDNTFVRASPGNWVTLTCFIFENFILDDQVFCS